MNRDELERAADVLVKANYLLVQQAVQERDALVAALKKITDADSRVDAVLIAEEALDRLVPGWREK